MQSSHGIIPAEPDFPTRHSGGITNEIGLAHTSYADRMSALAKGSVA